MRISSWHGMLAPYAHVDFGALADDWTDEDELNFCGGATGFQPLDAVRTRAPSAMKRKRPASAAAAAAPPGSEAVEAKKKHPKNDAPLTFVNGHFYYVKYRGDDRGPDRHGYIQVLKAERGPRMSVMWIYQRHDLVAIWSQRTDCPPEVVEEFLAERSFVDDYAYSDHVENTFRKDSVLKRVPKAQINPMFVASITDFKLTPLEVDDGGAYLGEPPDVPWRKQEYFDNAETRMFSYVQPNASEKASKEAAADARDDPDDASDDDEDTESKIAERAAEARKRDARDHRPRHDLATPELLAFRDSLCATDSNYFQTTDGCRRLRILEATLSFGNTGSVSQKQTNELMARVFLGPRPKDAPVPTHPRIKCDDLSASRLGTCKLCGCQRTLSKVIVLLHASDSKMNRGFEVGSECFGKVVHALKLSKAIVESRRWFCNTSRAGDAVSSSFAAQLRYHYHEVDTFSTLSVASARGSSRS